MSPRAKRAQESGRTILEQQSVKVLEKYGKYPSFEQIVFNLKGEVDIDYDAVSTGLYARHLRNWLKYFPRQQIHIINGTAFLKTPWTEINKLAEFAGVPPVLSERNFVFDEEKGFYCRLEKDGGCLGGGKGREHPEVPEEAMQKIREFYKPYNEDLYQLLGRRFNWQ